MPLQYGEIFFVSVALLLKDPPVHVNLSLTGIKVAPT